jgi:DNA adenine methylase
MTKPLVRWAGSKRQLLPILLANYERSCAGRYVEPFAGSASLFFAAEPERAVLGDINGELITVYRTLRRYPERIYALLALMPRDKQTYYEVRSRKPRMLRPIERAARFLYLNRFCFNGLYRTNEHGTFNVPYGGTRSGSLPTLDELIGSGKLLRRATLVQGDFSATLRLVEEGDFVYLDPPYQIASRRVFRQYHRTAFSVADLSRLRAELERVDREGASFLLSYADSAEGRALAAGYAKRRVRVRRNIAGFAGHRRWSYELLISNRRPL